MVPQSLDGKQLLLCELIDKLVFKSILVSNPFSSPIHRSLHLPFVGILTTVLLLLLVKLPKIQVILSWDKITNLCITFVIRNWIYTCNLSLSILFYLCGILSYVHQHKHEKNQQKFGLLYHPNETRKWILLFL